MNNKKVQNDLAIVGIGCRYPGGANTPEQLWELLLEGKDGFSKVPESRWDIERYVDIENSSIGKMCTDDAAFLEDHYLFDYDADFFNFTSREAGSIDPQQRLLHEVSWECFEDANIPSKELSNQSVGVYVGAFTCDNMLIRCAPESFNLVNQFSVTASTYTMLSNRLSYFYNFNGPSLTIDTACSSSLVALNYACRDLWAGTTKAALVAGVNAMLYPSNTIVMSTGGFLSPDGRSQAFDAKANGYARGEGCGAIFIKPLQDAIDDGNEIYAVIKGTGLNQDGKTIGIAAPNEIQQQSLIDTVIDEFNINRDDIVLVEAHGTGTSLGDPTEVSALAKALGKRTDANKRYISSIKGNIGHQEGGAGLAGIIKATLALKNGQAPKQCNFSEINENLNLQDGSFSVLSETTDLPPSKGQTLACVNSFGYGGTNAHAILGQWQNEVKKQSKERIAPVYLLALSAKDEQALKQRAQDIISLIEKPTSPSLSSISKALQKQVDHHDYRLAFSVSDKNTACSILTSYIEQSYEPGLIEEGLVNSKTNKLAFIYTGMGPQWWAMGQELYQTEPFFKKAMKKADKAFKRHSGWSILQEMLADETDSRMSENQIAQPANFILQYALTKLLEHFGLRPDIIIGHSVGEVGASLCAGALNLDDAALVAYHRSRLQQSKAGQGRMLATGLDIETAQEIVDLYEGSISIGAINSPKSIALSGDEDSLNLIANQLAENNIFAKLVFGEVAYHSHQMDDLEQDVYKSLSSLSPKEPTIPLYSTVTGQRVQKAMHDAAYWWKNIRQLVQFNMAMQQISEQGCSHFIEIGPNPVLMASILQIYADTKSAPPIIVSSLVRKSAEYKNIQDSIARLWSNGVSLTPVQSKSISKVKLPHYPWQRLHHWEESKHSTALRIGKSRHPLSGVKLFTPIPTWESNLNTKTLTLMKDHVINDRAIFPAAGYTETFISIAKQNLNTSNCTLSDISFESMLVLPEKDTLQVRTQLDGSRVIFFARPYLSDGDWKQYASAKILKKTRTLDSIDLDRFKTSSEQLFFDRGDIYDALNKAGLNYGPAFQVINWAKWTNGFVEAELELSCDTLQLEEAHIQPALLDGALQLMALLAPNSKETSLPVSISQISLFCEKLPNRVKAYVKEKSRSDYFLQADIIITDEDETPLIAIKGVKAQTIPKPVRTHSQGVQQYRMVWREREIETEYEPIQLVSISGKDTSFKNKINSRFIAHTLPLKSGYHIWVCDVDKGCAPTPDQAHSLTVFAQGLDLSKETTLVICTQNTWRVCEEDQSVPNHADIWGVARSLRRELANLNVICVDFDDQDKHISRFVEVLPMLKADGEFALRNNKLWQHHLILADNMIEEDHLSVAYQEDKGAYLETGERGGIDALNYRTLSRRKPRGDEIEVKIDHVSLNFKDVLKVFNRLTPQTLEGSFTGDSLGMEAHGRIVRTGPDSKYKIGEGIICSVKGGAFKSYVTFSPDDALVLSWDALKLSPADKSTLPISYSSAHFGLRNAGRLMEGETVLLHSASGGVGHAAIQVARVIGAKIIATAGTEEKRQHLRNLGIEHVFDARSLDFEQRVMDVTQNQGVDVLLNFLPDDFLHASIRILAPFGRLVELGKADIGMNNSLPLGEFERNLSFIAFDYDNLIKVRKSLAYELADEIYEYLSRTDYAPIEVQTYKAEETKDCFRELAKGDHIGKRVIDLSAPPKYVSSALAGCAPISKQATYIITGAYGGVGLQVVNWLIEQGAGSIMLCGRTIRETTELKEKALKHECILIDAACDIGNEDDVNRLFATDTPFPIRGIFHTAAVLADAPIANQDIEHFKTAYHAKAIGAYLLHMASLSHELELDYFVLFSSISATLGNHAQINYCAANSYLDGLADWRRQQGLTAISLSWGAIGDVGMLSRNEGIGRILAARGIVPIPIKNALDEMALALKKHSTNIGIYHLDWSKWVTGSDLSSDDPVCALISSELNKDDGNGPLSKLAQVSEEEGIKLITEFLVAELAKVLRRNEDKIRPDQPLSALGLDSLMAVEFQIGLETELSGTVSPDILDMQKSISSIAQLLYQSEKENLETSKDRTDASTGTVSQELDIDNLDEAQVDELLEELLAQEAGTDDD